MRTIAAAVALLALLQAGQVPAQGLDVDAWLYWRPTSCVVWAPARSRSVCTWAAT